MTSKFALLSFLCSLFLTVIIPGKAFALPNTLVKSSTYKSFKEWKLERLNEASQKLSLTKIKIDQKKLDPNLRKDVSVQAQVPEIERLQRQLRIDEMAVEAASDLTVTDYMAGYIVRQTDQKAVIQEVSNKLSPEEVAEIMAAYARSISEPKTDPNSRSADALPLDPLH